MTDQYPYDPEDWLVSASRAIVTYIQIAVGDDVNVENSYPDTRTWIKETPLAKTLIHVEQDDETDPVLGFGIPGVRIYDDDAGTSLLQEAAMHIVPYDIGVWASAESGGVTTRMQSVQMLKNLFTPATGRRAFNEATGGIQVVSFDGGRNELDRINDLPVWRAMGMTLIVRVFSRHVPATADTMVLDVEQDQRLAITGPTGALLPIDPH